MLRKMKCFDVPSCWCCNHEISDGAVSNYSSVSVKTQISPKPVVYWPVAVWSTFRYRCLLQRYWALIGSYDIKIIKFLMGSLSPNALLCSLNKDYSFNHVTGMIMMKVESLLQSDSAETTAVTVLTGNLLASHQNPSKESSDDKFICPWRGGLWLLSTGRVVQ